MEIFGVISLRDHLKLLQLLSGELPSSSGPGGELDRPADRFGLDDGSAVVKLKLHGLKRGRDE